MKALIKRLARILALCAPLGALPALAQDTLSLFPVGGEAKSHAGAGQVASRGAAAASYNPANMGAASGATGVVADTALDLASLRYSYTFPGYAPVAIDRVVPVPFAGLSGAPKGSRFTFGASLLPVPGAMIDEQVDDLPSRQLGTYPVLIDFRMRGRGTGYRAAAGVAYAVKGLSFGVSLLASRSEAVVESRDGYGSEVIATQRIAADTRAALVGARLPLLTRRLTAVATMRTPVVERYERDTELTPLASMASVQSGTQRGVRRGAPSYGLGLTGDVGRGIRPFAEGRFEPWSRVRQHDSVGLVEGAVAYRDVLELAAGSSIRLLSGDMTFAYRARSAKLADGTMAGLDSDEMIGMQFQNVDAMPTSTIAAGYARGSVDASLSYSRGRREVGADARGYGSYELDILSIGLGWRRSL